MKMSRPIAPILTLKLVAMATTLQWSEKEGQINNLRSWWKFGENRSGGSLDNLSKKFLKEETTGCTPFIFLNSEVNGPTFTKFTYIIVRSSQITF